MAFAFDAGDGDSDDHGAHHEGGGFIACSVCPTGQAFPGVLYVRAHEAFHESPDHEVDDEHHAQRIDSCGSFEEYFVDGLTFVHIYCAARPLSLRSES